MKTTTAAQVTQIRSLSLCDATVAELGAAYGAVSGIWDLRDLSSGILRELRRRGAVTNRFGEWVE